ncbi:hypothetical protein M0R45_011777 [Rubus argutus]|uniref:Phosphorylated adapter RNA export protein n=1 Tax=Rubus argutus TaxID=59490 RepID=A0AAW1YC03_RUBAR
MEGEDSILDSIYNGNFADGEDVEMVDVEEGELVEHESQNVVNQERGANQGRQSNKKRRRKKKNKGNNSGPLTNVFDIDRFVLETCKSLREKKSYMVYTAVGCLGVSALCDLITEVDAVQACGGQMTANGKRLRTGGGLLWNIIKAREPKAYKEIVKKAREFEKQFKQPFNRQPPAFQRKEGPSRGITTSSEDGTPANFSNDSQHASEMPEMQTQDNQSNPQSKQGSVRDRLRVPVSYDDDLLAGAPKDDAI